MNTASKLTREQVRELPKVSYPGGSFAYYDMDTDTYYNGSAQILKHPDEYFADNDGRYY